MVRALAPEFRVGTARTEITPPVGSELIGYVYPPRISTGVEYPLFLTSAVVARDRERVAVVSCDLIALEREYVDRAKELIKSHLGIPPPNVMVACTHIHTGPCTTDLFCSEADEAYLEELPIRIANCVEEAGEDASRASLEVVKLEDSSMAFNRRYEMRDGSVRTNPGIGNNRVLRPMGPTDPEIIILLIRDPDGGVRDCIFNYSNHVDVVGGNRISPDYPGILSRLFRERFGMDSNLIYLNGACGDVNHINLNGPPGQSGPQKSREMAERLFADLLEALEKTKEMDSFRLEGEVREIELPLRPIEREKVEWARGEMERSGSDSTGGVWAREMLKLKDEGEGGIETLIQGLRISDLFLVGFPGEVFTSIGLQLKRKLTSEYTGVVELANDYVGYLPTDEAFDQGGYEVRPARSSRVGRGTESILVESAEELGSSLLSSAGEPT